MDEFKRMTVWELLMFLQKTVKTNANVVRANSEAIDGVDSNTNVTPELLQTIRILNQQNKDLTSKNFSFLNLYNTLIDFHKNNKQSLIGTFEDLKLDTNNLSAKKAHFEDCIEQTISGKLILDRHHPYISNREFLFKLLALWRNREEYEKCAKVQEILCGINN
jgi:hypothetical protein